MDFAKLRVEKVLGGRALHVVLNAPKGNILDVAMMTEISAALDAVKDDRELRLVVFEGAGPSFSFGASVEEHTREKAPEMLATFRGVFERLLTLSIPTLSVVRGQCLGGGAELALFSTWVYATPDARIGFPELKLGVFPPIAAVLLPWRAGGARGEDLQLTARIVAADEALRLGLVDRVAADAGDEWKQLAEEHLFPKSASSIRIAERVARRPLARAFREDLPEIERIYLEELMATHDANEGIRAFMERRAPVFGGGDR
ncbi:enoyl-CoA hydratase/isomerase family protein [Myxococcota bacterium]|nr:enoyl-CoA hydratase/isomerase family protein [Myxococcota bacterium]